MIAHHYRSSVTPRRSVLNFELQDTMQTIRLDKCNTITITDRKSTILEKIERKMFSSVACYEPNFVFTTSSPTQPRKRTKLITYTPNEREREQGGRQFIVSDLLASSARTTRSTLIYQLAILAILQILPSTWERGNDSTRRAYTTHVRLSRPASIFIVCKRIKKNKGA